MTRYLALLAAAAAAGACLTLYGLPALLIECALLYLCTPSLGGRRG